MTTITNRVPAGMSTGGQFASTQHAEADVELATEQPVAKIPVKMGESTAHAPLPLGAAVTRLSHIDHALVENGHVLGPPQMVRDSDGSAPYEVYPVQLAGGRGLTGWWPSHNLAVTKNPVPSSWPIDAKGSPGRRLCEALAPGNEFLYVEDTDERGGVTTLTVRSPGQRFTVIVAGRDQHSYYSVIEHDAATGTDRVLAERAYRHPELCDGYAEAARALETALGVETRTCEGCNGEYNATDERGYDADGNGQNECPDCNDHRTEQARRGHY